MTLHQRYPCESVTKKKKKKEPLDQVGIQTQLKAGILLEIRKGGDELADRGEQQVQHPIVIYQL
jgi:hypothetical protein